jgi:UDP-2,3-diacylglucosamine hydrolase
VTALGILAGGGPLPAQVAQAARQAGRPVFVIGFAGFADPALIRPFSHVMLRLGAAGQILDALRKADCRDLVLIGPVKRPSIASLRPDAVGLRLLTRIGVAQFSGDNGLLEAIVRILGEEGFRVIGAQDVLQGSLGSEAALGRYTPDAQALADIERGVAVVRALGAVDVGQGCVVQQGIVLAVEAIEGTDSMLARCRALARAGPGGVLVKIVKPGQDRRADLPTIGPATVQAAADAGLRGIAFEAHGTLLIDPDRCRAEADKVGIFLSGVALDNENK